jgi:hypothetical protein
LLAREGCDEKRDEGEEEMVAKERCDEKRGKTRGGECYLER